MKKNTLAWFVTAGAAIALSGMGMAACSSSSSTGNPSNPTGDGGDTTTDGGGKTDGSVVGDAGGGGDSGGKTDGGNGCGSIPTLHSSTNDAGQSDIFCQPAATGGSAAYCIVDAGTANHCCIDTGGTGFPDGVCSDPGACKNFTGGQGLDIQCSNDQSCGAGLHCCGIGNPYISKTCDYAKVFGFEGTKCAADCTTVKATATDAGSFNACDKSDKTCPTGTVCTPAKQYIQLGACMTP